VLFLVIQWFFASMSYYSITWMIPVQIQKDFSHDKNMSAFLLTSAFAIDCISTLFLIFVLGNKWAGIFKIYQIALVLMFIIISIAFFIAHKIFLFLAVKGISIILLGSVQVFSS